MPQNQDPYGSQAYRQRIFKEIQSAINYRQVQRYGGFQLAPYATTGDPYFLKETLPAAAANRFTLRAPYSYVDKEGAPISVAGKSAITDLFSSAPAAVPPKAVKVPVDPIMDIPLPPPLPPVRSEMDDVASPSNAFETASQSSLQPQVGRPSGGVVAASGSRAKSAAVLRSKVFEQRAQATPPAVVAAATNQAKMPSIGGGRCSSAAVHRSNAAAPSMAAPPLYPTANSNPKPPLATNNGNSAAAPVILKSALKQPTVGGRRASSASVRSTGSSSSSIDPVVAAKVALLERTLQNERDTRVRLCNQLAQLETLLIVNSSPKRTNK